MHEILCRGISSIVVWRVGLLATSLRLVVYLVPTSLSSSLPLLVTRGGLIKEVLLSIDLSLGNRRIRGRSRCRLHKWWVAGGAPTVWPLHVGARQFGP